jgi:hypothetical protein
MKRGRPEGLRDIRMRSINLQIPLTEELEEICQKEGISFSQKIRNLMLQEVNQKKGELTAMEQVVVVNHQRKLEEF